MPYKKTGKLLVAFNDDEMETLKKLMRQGLQNGCKRLRIVDQETVQKMAPNVGGAMEQWVLSRLSEPAKGLPEPDALNCILCPNGCRLHYEEDGSISGNQCKRGVAYAQQ